MMLKFRLIRRFTNQNQNFKHPHKTFSRLFEMKSMTGYLFMQRPMIRKLTEAFGDVGMFRAAVDEYSAEAAPGFQECKLDRLKRCDRRLREIEKRCDAAGSILTFSG